MATFLTTPHTSWIEMDKQESLKNPEESRQQMPSKTGENHEDHDETVTVTEEEADDDEPNSPFEEDNNNNNDDPIARIYHTRKARRAVFRRFSVEFSTEQHFKIDEQQEPIFVGAFGNIRKQSLDHVSFHSHYRKERQWLHDSIIEDYLVNDDSAFEQQPQQQQSTQPDNKAEDYFRDHHEQQWLILTVGVQGSGKRHVVRTLGEEHIPKLLESFCCIDTDELCCLLPEYNFYLDHAPELANSLTQKEAGYIAETLCWAALQTGQSVLWDGSLRHATWFVKHILRVREFFPKLKVALIHVTAPSTQVIVERREKKELSTGRHLYPDDLDFLESEAKRISKAVEVLRSYTDFVATVHNSQDHGLQFVDQTLEKFCALFDEPDEMLEIPEPNNFALNNNMPSGNIRSSLRGSTTATSCGCHHHQRRRISRRLFSVLDSTEENHCSDDLNFYGRFADIRATLDYSYHKNYTFERQRFQDSILQDYLQGAVITDKDGVVCSTPTEPWIVFTAGPMGAGKSYTMRDLVQRGRFPLVAFVNVDPDELRRKLPEYHLYVNHAPQLAGELTRKEAGLLAEILTLAALQAGKNVLVDGSLRDAGWYKTYFDRLRKEFPVLRLAIIQVSAPKETILARATSRAEQTGRVVPESLLLKAFEDVPRSVEILEPLVDYHAELNNPADGDIQLLTKGETWESFTQQWVQTCAWVPKSRSVKKALEKQKELKRRESESESD